MLMVFIFTNPSAIFLWAQERILVKVGLEIFMIFAALAWVNSSKSASLIASNSSMVRQMQSLPFEDLPLGPKHLSPGKHFIQRVFLGLISLRYELWFIT